MSAVQQMFAREDERGAESPLHIIGSSFCRCRVPDGSESHQRRSRRAQTANIFDLGTKMARMSGTGIPALTVKAWHQQTRGPAGLMFRYFRPQYSHPLPVKQTSGAPRRVPFRSSEHHCYLQLCPPLVSTREEKKETKWKRSASSCWIQVWYAAYTKPEWPFGSFYNVAHSSSSSPLTSSLAAALGPNLSNAEIDLVIQTRVTWRTVPKTPSLKHLLFSLSQITTA